MLDFREFSSESFDSLLIVPIFNIVSVGDIELNVSTLFEKVKLVLEKKKMLAPHIVLPVVQ